MILRKIFQTALLLLLVFNVAAQNTRLNDRNKVGWWAGFGNIKLNQKWSIHAEYQWRRENFVAEWQQSLLRTGANYQLTPKIQLRAGYAWIETYPYGDYPINGLGRDFTEHRTFQMVTMTDKTGRLDFAHRFMLEQRWIGRYTNPETTREDDYFFVNRLRYMLRIQCPLQGNTLEDKEFYISAYDEIFIVFDQHRIGLLVGYRFNKKIRIEGGCFNQILQLPREIILPGNSNGQNVFQYNTGFVVNTYFNIDLNKKS
jgi:Protein of unknown function (DUF2490)